MTNLPARRGTTVAKPTHRKVRIRRHTIAQPELPGGTVEEVERHEICEIDLGTDSSSTSRSQTTRRSKEPA